MIPLLSYYRGCCDAMKRKHRRLKMVVPLSEFAATSLLEALFLQVAVTEDG